MNRRQKAILPALLIVWFLEHYLWQTIGYLLGDNKRILFAAFVLLVGFFPVMLTGMADRFSPGAKAKLIAYSNYNLMFLLLLLLSTLPMFILHMVLQSGNSVLLSYSWLRPLLALGSLLLCAGLFAIFFWTASHPTLTRVDLKIAKSGPEKGLRIVAISDIHYETVRDRRVVQRATDLMRGCNPDLVLILGDSVTQNADDFIADRVPELFASVPSTYGHYVITGNHDFYVTNLDTLLNAFISSGIQILRDDVVQINESIWLIGREDIGGMRGMRMRDRANLATLLQRVNNRQPIIVLDHQPRDFAANAALGIDLELCGHTHGGQLWPITYITARMFDLNYGLKKIGNSYFFVTSGLGYWGPPLRIGTKCEVLEINLSFDA